MGKVGQTSLGKGFAHLGHFGVLRHANHYKFVFVEGLLHGFNNFGVVLGDLLADIGM